MIVCILGVWLVEWFWMGGGFGVMFCVVLCCRV